MCVKLHTVCKTTHFRICVKLHTFCKTAHFMQYQSIFFHIPIGNFTLDWIFLHNQRLWWLWQIWSMYMTDGYHCRKDCLHGLRPCRNSLHLNISLCSCPGVCYCIVKYHFHFHLQIFISAVVQANFFFFALSNITFTCNSNLFQLLYR